MRGLDAEIRDKIQGSFTAFRMTALRTAGRVRDAAYSEAKEGALEFCLVLSYQLVSG